MSIPSNNNTDIMREDTSSSNGNERRYWLCHHPPQNAINSSPVHSPSPLHFPNTHSQSISTKLLIHAVPQAQ
ncbi:hypothetical protein BDZ45DRAFT_680056 [Acephala macrosclerotiorum]|nr:hypothetical protein BDZ45DRAFT_680056 [Acephala macrosclerotiorum]